MEPSVETETLSQLKPKPDHRQYSIFAMFLKPGEARKAVRALRRHGFKSADILTLTPDKRGSRDFVYHLESNVLTGVLVGAAVGFVLLGLTGILVGGNDRINLGTSSWIFTSAMASLGGLLFGAAAGALVGIGIPKPAVRRYRFYLHEGGTVVMMHLRNELDKVEAHKVLEEAGGQDISVLEETHAWSVVLPENEKLTFH